MENVELKELLDAEVERINRPEFIPEDPVQFPRRFSDLRDIEIVAFLSAIIAWGNRKMICRDAEKMLEIMGDQPYEYVRDGAYESLDPGMNIHRTFFARNLQHFLRGLHSIYRNYPSLDAFGAAMRVGEAEAPAWELVKHINSVMSDANGGLADSRALPQNLETTALKRINMALRWLVRDDGIVDMGVWKSIPTSKLYVPLDVHVGNTARQLGLVSRKANDRKTVNEIMILLRDFRPDDPAIYDYALFGIGIDSKQRV
ncbi:MAG: TIGR02757 family protein [Muribaculaceae bacterium]|nr:TIGR02757 family protein [Muribaculaceae bacterium]